MLGIRRGPGDYRSKTEGTGKPAKVERERESERRERKRKITLIILDIGGKG